MTWIRVGARAQTFFGIWRLSRLVQIAGLILEKTLRKLWRWAVRVGRVAADPMSKLQPADEWGVNAEHLSDCRFTAGYCVWWPGERIGVKGAELTTKYQFLLPYFVLGGMAGLRTCELAEFGPTDPF